MLRTVDLWRISNAVDCQHASQRLFPRYGSGRVGRVGSVCPVRAGTEIQAEVGHATRRQGRYSSRHGRLRRELHLRPAALGEDGRKLDGGCAEAETRARGELRYHAGVDATTPQLG